MIVLSFCFGVNAQDTIYRPPQHFVYPKVDVNIEAEKPESSVIERGDKHEYIFNYAFSSCYDTEYNLPLWVSHYLDTSLLNRKYNSRPNGYPSDEQYDNLKGRAFASSGYDHGHLAPAADFQWSKFAYLQSFLMTNMSPQHGCFNQKGWCHLEGTVRKWLEEKPGLSLYIASGAVLDNFIDTLCLPRDIKVFVPSHFYKVVLGMEDGKASFAVGYLVPNEDVSNADVPSFEVSVREVENITGLDFFSFLPRNVQDEVETSVPDMWYYDERVSCPDRDCEGIYVRRVKAEERSGLRCE